MIKETMMCEILKKAYGEPPINAKTCYNHVHPLVYPIEYDECPGCSLQKIIKSDLKSKMTLQNEITKT
jgi:hypothetical protein